MKIRSYTLLSLLFVLSMTYMVKAEDGNLKELNDIRVERFMSRVQAVMSELKIEWASNNVVTNYSKGILSLQKLETLDNFSVDHQVLFEDEGVTASESLLFSDTNGNRKASAEISYKKSAKAAQEDLFLRITLSSNLPLDLMISDYAIVDGPGDICIMRKVHDRTSDKIAADESQVYFIRGNVAIRVRSRDAGVSAKRIGEQLDKIIVKGSE